MQQKGIILINDILSWFKGACVCVVCVCMCVCVCACVCACVSNVYVCEVVNTCVVVVCYLVLYGF